MLDYIQYEDVVKKYASINEKELNTVLVLLMKKYASVNKKESNIVLVLRLVVLSDQY